MTKGQLSLDHKKHKQEAPLTRIVKDWLSVQKDVSFYKASDRYHKGVSDFIACVGGIFVGLELKAEHNTPSPHQKLFIKQVIQVGGIAGVCYTLGDAKALVEQARSKVRDNKI
jgi:hypothetical protein